MRRFLIALTLAAFATPVLAQVGATISIGEPGFYGRIDIGDFPPPRVVYREPVVVEHVTVVHEPPIYVHVPPGHEKHWAKHCARYGACGRPVYFVRDDWYNDVYVREYHHRHGHDDDEGEHHGHGHHGDHDDEGHGEGHGHGHGHDKHDD